MGPVNRRDGRDEPEMAAIVMEFARDYVDVGQRRGPEMFDEERESPRGSGDQEHSGDRLDPCTGA